MKKAFTLIELLISIMILSILMLFLYKSYSGLNKSNKIFSQKIEKITSLQEIKKTFYLDFYMAKYSTIKLLNQGQKEDVVFFQSSHSVHNRFEPNIAYIVKENILYRLESLQEFKEYPLASDSNFVVDKLGKIEIFRLYKAKDAKKKLLLVHVKMKDKNEIILKIPVMNESYKKN